MTAKRRYVQVGVGGRARMFSEAIVGPHADSAELVGLCDNNAGRLNLRRKWAEERGLSVRGYAAEDFDRMVQECEANSVIVTTKDRHHDEYICRAMELGCDVITEKPMTIDEVKCQRIIDTQRETGRKCTVTFNYRYAPPTTQVKDLLMSGIIGEVLAVEFSWLLDTSHGADYFRRWHRNKADSGGLLVHKATHHFDMVNWWLSAIPESVFAVGHRRFYTPETADRYGLAKRAERCLDCPEAGRCRFHIDMRTLGDMKELYLDNEQHDGYLRDRCVFSDEIDIEDSMHLVVSYDTGARMTYSLNAHSPWEGFHVAFNGTKGRLEHKEKESSYVSGDGQTPHIVDAEGSYIRIFPHFSAPYAPDMWTGEGGHGGGDPLLLDDIFSPNPKPDKYLRASDQRAGAYSILTGIAANHSMASSLLVRIDDLVQNIGRPDFPPMPSPEAPLADD